MKKQLFSKMLMIFTILILITANTIYTQPDTLWTKTFGGSNYDLGFSVQQTLDGGFIITGATSYGAGSGDVWLIKTNASGDTVWTKTFGGSNNDYGNSVQQTTDGGYIVTGGTFSYGAGGADVWLIKTGENGDVQWNNTFGSNDNEQGECVQQTTDGGFIIVGFTGSYGEGAWDVWLIKTDENGVELWSKTFGGSDWDNGNSVQQTSDGGYIITGSIEYEAGDSDVLLIKTDASGDTVWTKTFGGSNDDSGLSVQQTIDGGYVLTGYTESYGAGGADVWLIKTDASGDTVWTNTFGGSGYDRGYSVQQTTGGGYIITGYNKSLGGGVEDVWLIKTNASGDTVWTNAWGLNGGKGYSVQQTSDGGYIITGGIEYEAGGADVLLILVAPDTGFIAIEDSPRLYPNSFLLDQNYPNPFNPTTTISFELSMSTTVNLSIYNVTGQLVETLVSEHKNVGYHSVIWNASGVGSGLYFYRIEAGEYTETKKCVIIK